MFLRWADSAISQSAGSAATSRQASKAIMEGSLAEIHLLETGGHFRLYRAGAGSRTAFVLLRGLFIMDSRVAAPLAWTDLLPEAIRGYLEGPLGVVLLVVLG